MKCPLCDRDLQITERSGVEIDHCPQCRGVWLDRGELDKIVQHATVIQSLPSSGHETRPRDRYDEEVSARSGGKHRRQKPRSSWLSELFDFDN